MDLSYGSEMEAFREEVKGFLRANWPPEEGNKDSTRADQVQHFRESAIAEGYLCRSIPKQYGGSEQPADALRGDRPDLGPGRVGSWQVARDGDVLGIGAGAFARFELQTRVRAGQELPRMRELRLIEN